MSALDRKLAAALASREDRGIRRSLPPASLSHLPPTPGTTSGHPPSIASTTTTASSTSTEAPVDFSSNDYLSLTTSTLLRARFLATLNNSPAIPGSGGSRVIVYNHAHGTLEARLVRMFHAPAALIFNSSYDANVGFFACVPQPGDALLYDEAIHASVHDALKEGQNSVFIAVQSVYSMDGTVAPLRAMIDAMDEIFPARNAHLVVDEAHATGIYGPGGRGMLAQLELEDRVHALLHTFSKTLAASGAAILTSTLIRDYLLNYARPLIYTTSLSNAAIIAASCSFDLLEDGTAEMLAAQVLDHSTYFLESLTASLTASSIPPHILSLPAHLRLQPSMTQPPTPIIPLLTPRARALSAHLLAHGLNALPMSFPTVPNGTDRVRVCLHAGNTRAELDRLVSATVAWAVGIVREERAGFEGKRDRIRGMDPNGGGFLGSKL